MNSPNGKRQTVNTFWSYFCARRELGTGVVVSMSLLTATLAWSQPLPGSLDVHWNEGAPDCSATPQNALQVHAYEPQTFILRQSPCANFEANFLYLLIAPTKLFKSIPVPSRTRKRCLWQKRSWNYCRIRSTKSSRSWWRIPTDI